MHTKFLDYDARHTSRTGFSCVKCQKDIKPGAPHRIVRLVDGGTMILHPAEPIAGTYEDWPVGMDCAKQIGLEWTHPADPAK